MTEEHIKDEIYQDLRNSKAGMTELDTLLAKAREFHGGMCAGIVLGTRRTMIALRELGMNPMIRNKSLIVYVEIDRCVADAIQAITGCSLGHRSLKYRPYGKFAATYIDTDSGEARVSVAERKRTAKSSSEAMKDYLRILLEAPESNLFRIKRVGVVIPDTDMPGPAKYRTRCSRSVSSTMS